MVSTCMPVDKHELNTCKFDIHNLFYSNIYLTFVLFINITHPKNVYIGIITFNQAKVIKIKSFLIFQLIF